MNETAAFLTDHVIPEVPIRHWTLSLPQPLRYLLAYDSELCSAVINVFVRTVFGWLRRKAKRELGLDTVIQALPGAITAIHRVGSAINLNLHLHASLLDGVFVQTASGERPVFRALSAPEKGEVLALAWTVCQRTTSLLQKLGRYFDADPSEADSLAREHPLLAACYAASLQGSVALGERAGQRVLRLGRNPQQRADAHGHEQQQTLGHGFNLHAGRRVSAHDTKGKERLLRYILRPPIASERLSLDQAGRVIYRLNKPWVDGSTALAFDPVDFVAKLLPLVPPPRVNQIRYHGVFAPNSKHRAQVVPHRGPSRHRHGQLELSLPGAKPQRERSGRGSAQAGYRCGVQPSGRARPDRPDAIPWSELAARTFQVDVLRCPRCGGSPMRVIAVVATPTVEQLSALAGAKPPAVVVQSGRRPRAPPLTSQLQLPFVRRAA